MVPERYGHGLEPRRRDVADLAGVRNMDHAAADFDGPIKPTGAAVRAIAREVP